MANIQLLDAKTVNKIAAGEVVESPRSVVKELVENAIDAKATTISVEIKEGGTSLISITDNGCGIKKEELETAFLRHATSKLSQVEDLESLFTMGFRGEALASIAAVSQVEMKTKTADTQKGNMIAIHGGVVKEVEEVAIATGTTIAVSNLFYNVIARRKFLKKPSTEASYISELMHQFALGHPEISFRYVNNDTTMLYTTGNHDLRAAAFYVYGKDVMSNLVDVSYEKDAFSLKGLVGTPLLARANRGYENLFINGRYIKNSLVAKAVEDAYKTRLMVGKFPVFILHLEISPALIDINVHPSKLEVRFSDDDAIYDFFYEAVLHHLKEEQGVQPVVVEKKATNLVEQIQSKKLSPPADFSLFEESNRQAQADKKESKDTLDLLRGAVQTGSSSGENTESKQKVSYGGSVADLLNNKKKTPAVHQERIPFFAAETDLLSGANNTQKIETPKVGNEKVEQTKQTKQTEQTEQKKEVKEKRSYRIIGQLFETYWLLEVENSLYMIDQHAGHERILFEKIMWRFQNQEPMVQKLLIPIMMELSPIEVETLEENQDLLYKFGFETEKFTEDTYALKSVPYIVKEPSDIRFFMELLTELTSNQVESVYDLKVNAVATVACKAAVKGNHFMTTQEAEALIEQLMTLDNPFSCPHGRPTIVEVKKYEVEKWFKRIQN
ncbi:MAG: DNA mismatch repair endonuclease MutL [Bacillota bacterium]